MMSQRSSPKLSGKARRGSAVSGIDSTGAPENIGLVWWVIVGSALAVGLTWIFWWPLWEGGGLIGGDLYPYYFPQKAFLAESLKSGVIPLWNPRVGFGYPVLGESQTGALYPPNLVLYRLLSVNTAYVASQLAHYILAFAATLALARRLGLRMAGSLLASVVFVYGWFPPRICLEWAIIGGAWFSMVLWGSVAWLQTGQRRYLVAIALSLGMDLLAGHYNLAFITLLTVVPLPFLISKRNQKNLPPVVSPSVRLIPLSGLAISMGLGFLIAAAQLLPTWELKSLSQRQAVNDAFAPTYGFLPPNAISQLWMPWRWYAGEQTMDQMLGGGWLALPSLTNQAEAQLYVGLLPLALVVLGLIVPRWRGSQSLSHPWRWLGVVIVFLFLATGWPTFFLSNVPGFGFFRGPGRYSMTAVCGLGLLAGSSLDALLTLRNWNRGVSATVTAALLMVTVGDLWGASRQYQFGTGRFFGRQVFYATLLDDPPMNHLDESPLKKFFAKAGDNVRVYAPGQNIPTLLGVSALPVYLGLGPELYESGEMRVDFTRTEPEYISEVQSRLRRFGVTHLLLEQRISPQLWDVEPLGDWLDPFLNRALARPEPYYLYRLKDSPGRVSILPAEPENQLLSFEVQPNRVKITVDGPSVDQVVLRDLWYPGWKLADIRQTAAPFDEHFRSAAVPAVKRPVPRTAVWIYRPAIVMWGAVLSLLGLAGTALLPWLRWRRD